jgi:hypothetical protein
VAVLLGMLAGCGGDGAPSSPDRPPRDFFGVVADDVFAAQPAERRRILAKQRAAGVGLLRQTFDWSLVETSPGHFDFGPYDAYMMDLARAGMAVLPIIFNPPAFRSSRPATGARRGTYPPSKPSAMAHYAAALVARYGPRGSFWDANRSLPRRPIHSWQVWNEPSFPTYWPAGSDAREYAELLTATAAAIRAEDPDAEVVAAGLSNGKTAVPIRDFVTAMHAAGADRAYDVLAIHPYAPDPDGVLAQIRDTRALLEDLGKDAPIWVTEIGWATGGPKSPFTVSPRQQAAFVDRLIAEAGERREELGLRGVVYYKWQDSKRYPGGFDFFGLHTGLRELDGREKPALRAFADATKRAGE